MIVGTAGHVDHGKTSLVRALTGIDTDRLAEEKARGITIDLGFAYMPGPGDNTIGFVDVPGHERLVRTMVAGASGIDFALLAIAADDGVMPQTREHLDILGLLHLTRGLIAVTKSDRVDAARRDIVVAEIAATIAGTALARADIVFVSAVTGEGIAALRDRLLSAATDQSDPTTGGIFRMPVDRAFTLAGFGTIVTGTVDAGSIRPGDEVTLLPSGVTARVRSLHAQNREAQEGRAGERCALALSGAGVTKALVPRGAWICGEPSPTQTVRFDADVKLLRGVAIDAWTPFRFHCGASEVGARATALAEAPVRGPAHGVAQIVLDRPLPLRHGDLFVLRDQSARHTVGGGALLDPRAPLRRRRSAARLARLAVLRERDPGVALTALLDLEPGFEELEAFAADRGLTASQVEDIREDLGLGALPAGRATYIHTPARWEILHAAWVAHLATFHVDHPDLPGIAGEALRVALGPLLPKPLFAAVRDRLAADKLIALQGHWIRLPDHVARLGAGDMRRQALMIPMIAAQRFRPPRVRELSAALGVPEAELRATCKAIVRTGTLLELAPDQFFLHETAVEMARIAEALSCDGTMFAAADFRDRLGNGRKVAIQILESFDRQGLTRRDGDLRRVVRAPELIFGRPSPT